jgi:hypothetical protein
MKSSGLNERLKMEYHKTRTQGTLTGNITVGYFSKSGRKLTALKGSDEMTERV